MEIKIDGLDALVNEFELGDKEIKDSAIPRGLLESAKLIQSSAKLKATVATGQMKNDIQAELLALDKAEVFTTTEHSVYNEFGTGQKGDPSVSHTEKEYWVYRGEDGNFYTTKGMEPRPFMRPAAEENEDNVVDIILNEIGGVLD